MATIAVDFDGVIHTYSKGWADGTIYDPPILGALDGLHTLMQSYAVFVHTTRDPHQVAEWLHSHDVPVTVEHNGDFWNRQDVLLVTRRKLPAIAYVDDRAHLFTDWRSVLAAFVGG